MYENMSVSLSNCMAVAKRCVLLNCVPLGVPRLLQSFERHCGPPKRVFYWPEKERRGVLLLEANSAEELRLGLCRMSGFYRLATGSVTENSSGSHLIELPRFRVCSDPVRWPISFTPPPSGQKRSVFELKYLENCCLELQPAIPSAKDLHSKLLSCTSITEQASVLFEKTRLTYPELLARFVVSDSIQEILGAVRPETEVSIFGSAVDGLGASTSDLDLVINLGSKISSSLTHVAPFENLQKRFPGVPSSFPLIPALVVSDDKLKPVFLSLLRRLLVRLDPLGFHRARIYRGRIPILHVPHFSLLGVGLDISREFDGPGEINRRRIHAGRNMATLMRSLAQCVPEFPQCVTVLKFIARRSELTRQGPNPGFTNFKLTVLFIHFLQAHGYAPSIDRLLALLNQLSNENSTKPVKLNDIRPLPPIDVLLDQLFTYIPTINPSHFLISLHVGRLIPRANSGASLNARLHIGLGSAEEEEDDALHSFDNDDSSDSFAEQDYVICPNPLNPCHNMLRGIDESEWALLVRTCEYWHKALHTHSHGPSPWGLLALKTVSPNPRDPVSGKHPCVDTQTKLDENFLALCASDYYKGCIFHRNIKGFIVQTGDPTGTGKNGQSIWKKKFKDEFHESLRHNARGIVSMANNGPDSNGSQFFITYSKQTMLDMKYSIFAKVIDGWNVLDELERSPVEEKTYRPLTDIHIQNVTIHANPFAE